MRTITKTLFRLSELNADAKQTAIANLQNSLGYLTDDWYLSTFDVIKRYLGCMGMQEIDITFDGFNTSHDHAFFTAYFDSQQVDLVKLNEIAPQIAEKFSPLFIDFPNWRVTGEFKDSHHAYVAIDGLDEAVSLAEQEVEHAQDGRYEYEEYPASEETILVLQATCDRLNTERDKAYETAETTLAQLHQALCEQIFSQLQDRYDYLLSSEVVARQALDSGSEFTEDGELFI